MLLNLVIVGKIVFSVKLCVSTHEGLGRRTALPGVDSTHARWSQTRVGKKKCIKTPVFMGARKYTQARQNQSPKAFMRPERSTSLLRY